MKNVYRAAVIYIAVMLVHTAVFSETFRVHTVHTAQLSDNPAAIKMGVNDSLAVMLPQDRTFLQGISLEIKIPREIAAYRDSVAYSFYRGVSPVPKQNIIDYSGARQLINTFPGRLSWNIIIPAKPNHSFKSSPYSTVLPFTVDQTDAFVFFRLQLVMKGAPIDFDSPRFTVEIKPIYSDEGYLQLDIAYPEKIEPAETAEAGIPAAEDASSEQPSAGESLNDVPVQAPVSVSENAAGVLPYTVYIDTVPVKDPLEKQLLSAGVHHISLVSDLYRSEVRTVTVPKASSVTEKIQLRDITPTLLIAAPESALVFLNDKPAAVLGSAVPIPQGDYLVRIQLGDYETVRKFTAVNGKSYTVSVTVDMVFTEE